MMRKRGRELEPSPKANNKLFNRNTRLGHYWLRQLIYWLCKNAMMGWDKKKPTGEVFTIRGSINQFIIQFFIDYYNIDISHVTWALISFTFTFKNH
jgi:hypothetical protein